MTSAKEIGERIKKVRMARHLTQKQLAEKVFMDERSIAHYEHGNHEMTVVTFANIAKALKVSANYLLFGKKMEAAKE